MSLHRTIVASSLMIMTILCLKPLSFRKNIQLNKSFSTFPRQIGNWIGQERHFDQRIYDILGVDDSILYNYVSNDGSQIELYIAFYGNQRKGDLIHSPRNCMPGAGWNFISESKALINIGENNAQNILINQILLQNGNKKKIMFYWFQGRGRYITSEYMQKLYLVLDSITKHRTDEAFIRIVSSVIEKDEKKTIKKLTNFTTQLIPILQEYIPS